MAIDIRTGVVAKGIIGQIHQEFVTAKGPRLIIKALWNKVPPVDVVVAAHRPMT